MAELLDGYVVMTAISFLVASPATIHWRTTHTLAQPHRAPSAANQPAAGHESHRMNDRHWKCQEKRRSNEHGPEEPKEKQAHREPQDENQLSVSPLALWTSTQEKTLCNILRHQHSWPHSNLNVDTGMAVFGGSKEKTRGHG